MKQSQKVLIGAFAAIGVISTGVMFTTPAFAQGGKSASKSMTVTKNNASEGNQHDLKSEKQEGADTEDEMLTAPVNMGQAVNAALGGTPGFANAAELEDENGTLVWSIDVVSSNGNKYEVKVNATNRAVISSKIDSPDGVGEDEDHDGEHHEGPGGDGDGETNDDSPN